MAQATVSSISALTVEQAAAVIVSLINERPRSPCQDEVQAIIARAVGHRASHAATSISALESSLLEAISESAAAEKVIDDGSYNDEDAADAQFHAALERVDELAAQLPDPPRSITDIVLRAKVAYCHADKDARGRLAALSSDEVGADEAAAARLIDAVLRSADMSR